MTVMSANINMQSAHGFAIIVNVFAARFRFANNMMLK